MANLGATYRGLEKYIKAERLERQVLDASSGIFGVEHLDTIRAMANLAATYHNLERYTEAEQLMIQVLDARNRILGAEHPDTINAMGNLAVTYYNLGRYTEAEKLENQAHELKGRVFGAELPDTITTMANLQETQEMQVLDADSIVPGEDPHSTQVFLDDPVQAVLPDITIHSKKKGMYFGNCCLHPL